MSIPPADLSKDLRRQIRRKVRNATDVVCRRGTTGMGSNIGIRMLDISEEGIRLLVREPVTPGEELEISFTPLGCNREVIGGIFVVWCHAHEGVFTVAGKFRPPLSFEDVYHVV